MDLWDFVPGVNVAHWASGKGLFGNQFKPGGMFGGSPDYAGLANQQAQTQKDLLAQQTQANRPNQVTPFGSSQWSKDANGNWTQTTSLSPELQGLFGTYAKQAQDAANQGPMDVSKYQQQAQDALYNKQAATLDPQYRQMQSGLNTQIANEGLDPTSAAARMQQNQLARQRTGAYSDARMNSIVGGGQEASRLFGMDLTNRMLPMQQMSGLFGLGKMPAFMGAGMAQAPDLMDAAKLNQQGNADQMKGLMSLFSAFAGM